MNILYTYTYLYTLKNQIENKMIIIKYVNYPLVSYTKVYLYGYTYTTKMHIIISRIYKKEDIPENSVFLNNVLNLINLCRVNCV